MQTPLSLPLAADWVQALVPLVVMLFWVIRQVLEASRPAQPPAAPRPAGRPMPPELRGPELRAPELRPPDQRPPRAEDTLRQEMERVLRRAAEKSGGARPSPGTIGSETNRSGAMGPGPKGRNTEPPRRLELIVENPFPGAEAPSGPSKSLTEPEGSPKRGSSRPNLAHLPQSRLAEHASQLGSVIAQADERIEARLHKKFDHRLGTLEERGALSANGGGGTLQVSSPPSETSPGDSLVALLRSPEGVRQAFVLNEILRPRGDTL